MKNVLKKTMLGLCAASVAAASVAVPAIADNDTEVAPQCPSKGTVKALNVDGNATVKLYPVVVSKYNAANKQITGWREIIPGSIKDITAPTAEEVVNLAEQATAGKLGNAINMTKEGSDYTAQVQPGMYLVVAVDQDAKYVYNPAIVALNPESTTGDITLKEGTVSFNEDYKTAYMKKSVTQLTKEIVDSAYNAKGDFASTDEKVKFEINSKIPSYSAEYKNPTFVVTDTLPEGLDGFEDLKVAIDGEDAAGNVETSAEGKKLTVTVKPEWMSKNAGKQHDLKITYSTALQDKAKVQTGLNANQNSVEVKYSHTPNEEPKVEKEIANVYTVKLAGKKVDSLSAEKGLKDAEFTLYKDADCKEKVATAISKEDGSFEFDKTFDTGTYYIKETKAPEGYNIDETAHKLELSAEMNEKGEVQSITSKLFLKGDDAPVVTTIKGKEAVLNMGDYPNTKFGKLPSAGSMAMGMAAIAGIAIIAASRGYEKHKQDLSDAE